MTTWLERVGELTAKHREGRALHFARLARRRVWKRRVEGFSEIYAKVDGAWYTARERGQRERPRAGRCVRGWAAEITCVACGTVHERRSG